MQKLKNALTKKESKPKPFPKKSAKLRRMIRNYMRLKIENQQADLDRQIDEANERAARPQERDLTTFLESKSDVNLTLLINLQQKQIDDLKTMFYDLEEELNDLKNEKKKKRW